MPDDGSILKSETKPRARQKAENRAEILQAAQTVFAEMGYGAATIRDIIRRTNLASGTFYNYFRSKEEVLAALEDESAKKFRPLLIRVRDNSEGFKEYVYGAYLAYFTFFLERNAQILTHETIQGFSGAHIHSPEFEGLFNEIKNDLANMIATGNAPEVDVDMLTASAIGIAREMGDHLLKWPDKSAEEAARFASKLLLNGIL